MKGFSLGLAQDIDATATACYIETEKVTNIIENFFDSFRTLRLDNYLQPYIFFNQLLVEASDLMVVCDM